VRIVVFGASGRTRRLLVGQALAGGHEVVAVTRHPDQMPFRNRLAIVGGDVADPTVVDAAVAGGNPVLSGLGVPYSRKPIDLYSAGTANIIAAMTYHGLRRLAVAGTGRLDWTIVRACWLFNSPSMEGYQVIEGGIHGMFTSREHLAACLLAQLADDRYIRKTIGIVTTSGPPSVPQQIWREVIIG
jgi:NAD(P)H-binding